MREYGLESQVILTGPILEGLDARMEDGRIVGEKMSKSLDNYVSVAEPPSEMFGKLMSISDDLMWRYAELLSGRPLEAIRADRERVARGELHPKDVKVAFAREMVARFHGAEAGARAAEEFERRFSRREIDPDQFPEVTVGTGGAPVPLLRAMVDAQLVASTSEGRRLISQGAVRVDGERVSDPKAEVAPGTHLVQVGKLRAARLTVR
jgi:tyrosyl-tRNA synthetase